MSEKDIIYYELLVLRCQKGEEGALEELIRNWEKRLFYYVRRLVKNEQDAWDILQQTWIKVLRGIKHLREPRSLPAWLYHIARNAVRSYWRTELSKQELPYEDKNPPDIAKNSEQFRFEDAEQVHYGLGQISLPHREVLTLHFLEDFSVEEIAEVLEVPPGTVKSRLYYAKRALKDILEKEDKQS